MAPFYPFVLPSPNATATAIFPSATMPRPPISTATNDVHTLPYPPNHNYTSHGHNGSHHHHHHHHHHHGVHGVPVPSPSNTTYVIYNGTSHHHHHHHHHHLGNQTAPPPPDSESEPPILPEMPLPLPVNGTKHNQTAPSPPTGMTETPILPDAPILPRGVNFTQPGVADYNQSSALTMNDAQCAPSDEVICQNGLCSCGTRGEVRIAIIVTIAVAVGLGVIGLAAYKWYRQHVLPGRTERKRAAALAALESRA